MVLDNKYIKEGVLNITIASNTNPRGQLALPAMKIAKIAPSCRTTAHPSYIMTHIYVKKSLSNTAINDLKYYVNRPLATLFRPLVVVIETPIN